MKRRGWTLVETLVVMTTGSVMFGVAATLLYTIMRAEQAARHELERHVVLNRLADQFRSDAHAATRCEALAAEGEQDVSPGWRFELPAGGSVVYQNGPDGLARTERIGQAVQRRESYRLPAETTARIEVQSGSGPALVSLSIAPVGEAAGPTHGEQVRVEAVLGKDHRYAGKREP